MLKDLTERMCRCSKLNLTYKTGILIKHNESKIEFPSLVRFRLQLLNQNCCEVEGRENIVGRDLVTN